jgi:hypothetical protein
MRSETSYQKRSLQRYDEEYVRNQNSRKRETFENEKP